MAFVAGLVRTTTELQFLMAIVQFQNRWWDAAAAAEEFGMTKREAGAALDRFAAGNLLDIKITEDIRYQYRPGTPELRDAADATLEAYRRRPFDMARLIEEPGRRSVSDFADAFRFRRDDR